MNKEEIYFDESARELYNEVYGGGGSSSFREGSLIPLKEGDKIFIDLSKLPYLYVDFDYNANIWGQTLPINFNSEPIQYALSNGVLITGDDYIDEQSIKNGYGSEFFEFITTNEARTQLLLSLGDGQGGGTYDQYGDIIDAAVIYEGDLSSFIPEGVVDDKIDIPSEIIYQLPIIEITVTNYMEGYIALLNYWGEAIDHIEYVSE